MSGNKTHTQFAHTRCIGGRSCPGEGEVGEGVVILYCQIHYSQMVAEEQVAGLGELILFPAE